MQRIVIFIFKIALFLTLSNTIAQEQEYLTGKLLDSKTSEPVVFATVRIKGKAKGVITNMDGSFRLPLRFREDGESIELSSMGFQKKEISLLSLSTDMVNLIYLKPAVLSLPEATVSIKRRKWKLSAKEIVQKAIDALLVNYPTNPYTQVGYYRDYQLDKSEYVNLNEGVFEVYDQGFKAIDSSTTKVSIYDYHENLDFRKDTLARRPYNYNLKGEAKIIDKGYLSSYGGNEFSILSIHNAIRNHSIDTYSFVHKFDTDLLNEHEFFIENESFIGDEVLYTIKFMRILSAHSAYGRLYISKYDFSIYKMEYTVYDETKNNLTGLKDKNESIKQTVFDVTTSYRPYGDKMYLSYISFNNMFKIWEPPIFTLDYLDIASNKTMLYEFQVLYNFKKKVANTSIILTFSENLDPKTVNKTNQFKVTFKGKRIALEEFSVAKNKVILYPKTKTLNQIERIDELLFLSQNDGLNEHNLKVEAKKLKDVNGNILNEWLPKEYHQFREFFVQEIKQNPKLPLDGHIMDRRKPILMNQRIRKPDDFKGYWMNTPLKSLND